MLRQARRVLVVGLAALLLAAGSAPAASPRDGSALTAGKLATDCGIAGGASHLFCLGYIRGVVEAEALRPHGERAFCPPALDPAARRQIFRQ